MAPLPNREPDGLLKADAAVDIGPPNKLPPVFG